MTAVPDHVTRRRSTDLVAAPTNPRDVLLLQSVRAYPAVSVLMTTTPGHAMTVTDQTRLRGMVDAAVLRLRKTPGAADATMLSRLNQLCQTVCQEPPDQAVALFVGPGTARAFRLGVPVVDRVVLEETFATRDLVLALQRTPRHLVLILSSREARLFESVNGHLQPAATHAFPCRAERARRSAPARPRLTEADTSSFLRGVDRRLGVYRALHPSPLVVVGPAPVVNAYLGLARNAFRLAGTLSGNHVDASLGELSRLLQPVLQRYLASREQEALELLDRRSAQGRVVSTMSRCWLAARTQQPEMLAVEQGLFYPAQVSRDGHTLTPSTELNDPDVIDDAVDELIEHVLIRGGWVAMVRDGRLHAHEGVALAVR